MQEVDKSEEEAAKTMGANEIQIFSNVVLPAIKGGLISGSVFTFARSLGEFGATIMVSGNLALRTQTAPLFIFSEFNKGNIEAASAMSVVLVIISFALFFGFKFINKLLKCRVHVGRGCKQLGVDEPAVFDPVSQCLKQFDSLLAVWIVFSKHS